jgi:hypothetical protein
MLRVSVGAAGRAGDIRSRRGENRVWPCTRRDARRDGQLFIIEINDGIIITY